MKTDIQKIDAAAPIISELLKVIDVHSAVFIAIEPNGEKLMFGIGDNEKNSAIANALCNEIQDAIDSEDIPLRNFN